MRNINCVLPGLARLAGDMTRWLNQNNTVALVALLALWRLYLSAGLQLHPDEAYYWLWSRHLDIGYFDHPPMVAYFIRLSTLFSNSELWVRLTALLVLLSVSVLLWRLAMQLFKSEAVAAGSVLLFNFYPLTMLGTLLITPDVPVLLFWSLSIYLFWQIMERGQVWRWYLLGLSFGLALLSKYTAVLMLPCFLLYLLLTPDRRWLRTPHPYLALLLGFFCFLPVLWWNSRNGWISFAFQFRNGLGGEGLSVGNVAEYSAGQMLIVGPLVWLIGWAAAWAAWQRRDRQSLLLVCTSVPVILFFALSSLRKAAGPNWPACAYFSFSILVSHYALAGYSRVRRPLWWASLASTLALALLTTVHARFSILPLQRYAPELATTDATNAFHGWRELGAALKRQPYPDLVVTPSHQLSAEIAYYTGQAITTQTAQASRPSQFNILGLSGDGHGKQPLYIWTDGDFADPAQSYFAVSAPGKRLSTYREANVVRNYYIAAGRTNLQQTASIPAATQP